MPTPGYQLTMIMGLLSLQTRAWIHEAYELAHRSFPLSKNKVANYQAMWALLLAYVVHCKKVVHKVDEYSASIAATELEHLMKNLRGGERQAFHDCVSGVNGGVARVLNDLKDLLIREHDSGYIKQVFRTELENQYSGVEIAALFRAFAEKYRAFLDVVTAEDLMLGDWQARLVEVSEVLNRLEVLVGDPMESPQ